MIEVVTCNSPIRAASTQVRVYIIIIKRVNLRFLNIGEKYSLLSTHSPRECFSRKSTFFSNMGLKILANEMWTRGARDKGTIFENILNKMIDRRLFKCCSREKQTTDLLEIAVDIRISAGYL